MATLKQRQAVLRVLSVLEQTHDDAHIALEFSSPFELLVATILSAQCTDVRVNQVTKDLFRKYPTVKAYAGADPAELEQDIRSIGFYRNKARNLIGCAAAILDRHAGEVPGRMEELTALPGVGRKTANVVLGNAFDIPGMVVDTHVKRVATRLSWTRESDPVKIEYDLCRLLPQEKWCHTSHVLIFHGRRICKAPVPLCSTCPVSDNCPRTGVKKTK